MARTGHAASVRARLLNQARASGFDFQTVVTRYGIERFLYRLTVSPHASQFVLKGALLFLVWERELVRPTKDIDLLGFVENDERQLHRVVREIIQQPVADDGVRFDVEGLRVAPIREQDDYGGLRAVCTGSVSGARFKLQIDVGFGDAITPRAVTERYPVLLPTDAVPSLRVYPRPTVVAEKFEALVSRGLDNSRMKDFFDLFALSARYPFEGNLLARAIRATFARRGTAVPDSPPIGLSAAFATDETKVRQWTAFLSKSGLNAPALAEVVGAIEPFLMPAARAAAREEDSDAAWPPGGPWR